VRLSFIQHRTPEPPLEGPSSFLFANVIPKTHTVL